MNTAKGVASVIAKSPKAIVSLVTALSGTVASVFTVLRSELWHDDFLLLVVIVMLLYIIYCQPDWALSPVESLAPQVVWRIPVKSSKAALTIDDVPLLKGPTSVEKVLDVLRKHEVKATLFIMSGFDLPEDQGGMDPKAREKCRQLLKRAVEEGHELGNHLKFDRPAIAQPVEEFDADFDHCDKLIAELSGGKDKWAQRPYKWFRPASAMWTDHILRMADQHDYRTVVGNCYPHDVASVSRFVNSSYLTKRVRKGAVVIVHDRFHTPETLDEALPNIKKQGIELCTLSDLQTIHDKEWKEKSTHETELLRGTPKYGKSS
eukprot:CAMPEP_0206460166 /NCGR_PEP_ID=MMETSP0324_2-20121206/24603_1 /ASSEMBLY_ACC=CAM_ASM_000836 /TAXON_ID=2866 /ORGANISM="Crypthecodinium cohnii, Strain Seligo" /LENGTH=318 /DNA_ID=CAMNT_0053931843 /DNA_START=33 /DNA_END=989 /DNA_ORIENTATION=+